MTAVGLSEPKMAVPATMTLLPDSKMSQLLSQTPEKRTLLPASAQTPMVLGPTPPSTSMSLSGNRARSSATLETHRSRNFCPPRP